MKSFLPVILFISLIQYQSFGQSIFNLKPSQSMSITGKGPGQDAAENPFAGEDCYAIVDNIGNNEFSIRIQFQGKVIKTVPVPPKATKTVQILKGYELYFDTELATKAEVKFEKRTAENSQKQRNGN